MKKNTRILEKNETTVYTRGEFTRATMLYTALPTLPLQKISIGRGGKICTVQNSPFEMTYEMRNPNLVPKASPLIFKEKSPGDEVDGSL